MHEERRQGMKNKSRWILSVAYFYLAIPVLIFVLSWMRWYIGIPLCLLICYGLFRLIYESPATWIPHWNKCTVLQLIISIALIAFFVWLSGIGQLSYQNSDHYSRNAAFDALCSYSWPIYEQHPMGYTVSLVYYIGFWLPAAVMGKLFGATFGYIFMMLWAMLGISLFYLLICVHRQKLTVVPLLIFLAFSGLDALLQLCVGNGGAILSFSHIEWSFSTFQYSSFVTQLFWAFNQAIPAWLITVLLFYQKNNRNIVFLLSLTLLSCTLPFVGMIPIVLYLMFGRKYERINTRKEWWSAWFRDTFTLQNVVCGGVITLFILTYLLSNTQAGGSGPEAAASTLNFVWSSYPNFWQFLWRYLLFVLTEFGIYAILIYRITPRKGLFWVTIATLAVVPLICIGVGYDFCMRASIPAMVVLYMLVCNALYQSFAQRQWRTFLPLLAALVVGAITPLHEVMRSLIYTFKGELSAGTFDIMVSNAGNFIANIENSIFYRFFAK